MFQKLWLVEDQATTSGSTVFIKLSFHFRWFKWTLNLINPLLWCELLWWCPSHTFFFLFFMFFYFMFCSLSLSLPPFLYCFIVLFFYIYSVCFSQISRQFQFNYFSEQRFQFLLRKFYGILSEKAFPSTCMHFYTKVGEKITGGWCLHSRIRFTHAHTQYSLTC